MLLCRHAEQPGAETSACVPASACSCRQPVHFVCSSLKASLPRSRFTKPDSRVYLTRAFQDLHGGHVEVQGPFNPYIPCSLAALQPREYLIREPLVVDAPLACVWCALACPTPSPCL